MRSVSTEHTIAVVSGFKTVPSKVVLPKGGARVTYIDLPEYTFSDTLGQPHTVSVLSSYDSGPEQIGEKIDLWYSNSNPNIYYTQHTMTKHVLGIVFGLIEFTAMVIAFVFIRKDDEQYC